MLDELVEAERPITEAKRNHSITPEEVKKRYEALIPDAERAIAKSDQEFLDTWKIAHSQFNSPAIAEPLRLFQSSVNRILDSEIDKLPAGESKDKLIELRKDPAKIMASIADGYPYTLAQELSGDPNLSQVNQRLKNLFDESIVWRGNLARLDRVMHQASDGATRSRYWLRTVLQGSGQQEAGEAPGSLGATIESTYRYHPVQELLSLNEPTLFDFDKDGKEITVNPWKKLMEQSTK